MKRYAHSVEGRPANFWEPLSLHLAATADRASVNASHFGFGTLAGVAGRLHDIGKASAEFQGYIAGQGVSTGPNHSSAGAVEALRFYGSKFGRLLAFTIAGHHAGLLDGTQLFEALDTAAGRIPDYTGWEEDAGPLPDLSALLPTRAWRPTGPPGFSHAFLTRMIFSALVDADFLATEAFYLEGAGVPLPARGAHTPLDQLNQRLDSYLKRLQAKAAGPVATLRAQILGHTEGRASEAPGLFTLTVPTGGGKTLTSLSFALKHALAHDLRRVIVVIPFTSIIEQTAGVFREALESQNDIVEHHSAFDWDRPEGEAGEGLAKLRRAAENWDAPIIVTTAVQFFESLFAARPSRCRKLHNLARAVIILDEAQMMPLPLLRPCMAALDELAANYGCSIILCTATQPALRRQDGLEGGLDLPESRELAPDPKRLFVALRRVRVERAAAPVSDSDLVQRFTTQPQMLCIVNSRRHARALYGAMGELPGRVHLSTLMCAKHRSRVMAEVHSKLDAGEPIRIASTSVLEAGVDLDVPEVWRAAAGLDSIAQAAGRCNRNGRLPVGRVVVFQPDGTNGEPPAEIRAAWQVARDVMPRHEDPLTDEAIREYFSTLYWSRGSEALDALEVDGRKGVLNAIAQRAGEWAFAFRSIAEQFRFIAQDMLPILIPWDEEAEGLLAQLGAMDRPASQLLRRLQPYTVAIPRNVRADWLARGALAPVHPLLGNEVVRLTNMELYDCAYGVNLDGLGLMPPEQSIW